MNRVCFLILALSSLIGEAAFSQAEGENESPPVDPGSSAKPAVEERHSPEEQLFRFLGNYCLECHDSLVQKAEREFESFDLPLENVQDLISAQEIVDQVTLGEMPPPDADFQPTDEERLALIRVLREGIAQAGERIGSSGARTVMRRLSHREYENTLETLLGRRIDTLGLTADFPKEKTSRHLDTIGESLVTSGFLLDQYFQAANRLVEHRLAKPEMEPRTWHFTDNFRQYEELSGAHRAFFKYETLALYEQPNTDTRQGGYAHIEDFLEGVPVSGNYEIKALAQAFHRDTHYDPEIFGIDFSEPFRLGVVPGDVTAGHIHYPQPVEPRLGEAVVPDDRAEWITFRVWLEKGQTPRFIFPNGPYESRASVMQINKRYKDEFTGDTGIGVSRTHILRQGALPHLRIEEVKIRGPLPDDGGSVEERAVFGRKGFQAERAVDQLYSFGERAFRRPLDDLDRRRIRGLYEKRLGEKASPRRAALDTVTMILCSPSFLYLPEVTPKDESLLRPFDLASRLSYALWAGPPDEALLASAASGALSEPAELRGQVERMLSDPRSEEFVKGFLDSWLNLRDIGKMPPPRRSYRAFYAEDLPASMKSEVRLFFRHLLETNGPVTDFLDADYTFVDKKLARHYNLPAKDTLRLADGFEKVSVAGESRRGGVLGMAGVLTVSANGVDTSPVTRGVYVLENILGVIPPAPPDEVPSLDSADVRGAKTIREKLKRHSSVKICYECHRKIDPLGFALENFDPVGRWRGHYPKPDKKSPAPRIDSGGEFPSGESFDGFPAFKKILLETRHEVFARHLVSTLLAYANGRHMEAVDRYEMEQIAARTAAEGNGLRTLVIEALSSEIFRSR